MQNDSWVSSFVVAAAVILCILFIATCVRGRPKEGGAVNEKVFFIDSEGYRVKQFTGPNGEVHYYAVPPKIER